MRAARTTPRAARRPRPVARALLSLAGVAALLQCLLLLWTAWHVARAEHAHPPIGARTVVDGRALHHLHLPARDRPDGTHGGDTPALVLLHGGGTSLLDLRAPLGEGLADAGFDVWLFDRPGHGYSEALPGDEHPDAQARLIASALSVQGVTDSIWIGHSRAAAVALAGLSADGPARDRYSTSGRPADAVLLAPSSPSPADPAPLHTRWLARPLLGRWFAWSAVATFGRAAVAPTVARAFSPDDVPEDYVERTGLALSLRPGSARVDAHERFATAHWWHDRRADPIPDGRTVLVIEAGRDAVVEPLPSLPGDVRRETISGAGHALVHTHDAQLVERISAFVRDDVRSRAAAPADRTARAPIPMRWTRRPHRP